jgi:hypothetical protein
MIVTYHVTGIKYGEGSFMSLLVGASVLLQEWRVVCYNEPDRLDPRSLEPCHERSVLVQMAPL